MAEQGAIVLIPIPFTDLSSQKRRPVVIISNDAYNRTSSDIIVVAITSNPAPVDYSFAITSADLVKGTLNRPSKIRVDKIYTLSQSIIVKAFGQVNTATLERIHQTLQNLVGEKS
ncbi:MAG: type II toxin-antitoxin system PemK/MazF family toxin [Chloroflexi bacterium]|nr:type II toxin-antitoxin system PemK/MazF family toxin [Chloroflexota bacterium]